MPRTYVVTGSASGIGAATRATLEASGHRVVGVDLRDAEVIFDLATQAGRHALGGGVAALVDACLAGDEELAAAAADRSFERDSAVCYNSAKRALARWVRRHAPTEQWAGASIPLNAIAPGVIVTPMGGDYISTPEGRAAMAELVPMPLQGPLDGYGSPEQVAALLVWLASAENSLVTGQLVAIDGGADAVTRGDDIWADPVRTRPTPEHAE